MVATAERPRRKSVGEIVHTQNAAPVPPKEDPRVVEAQANWFRLENAYCESVDDEPEEAMTADNVQRLMRGQQPIDNNPKVKASKQRQLELRQARDLAHEEFQRVEKETIAEYLAARRPEYEQIIQRTAEALAQLIDVARDELAFRQELQDERGILFAGTIPPANVAVVRFWEMTSKLAPSDVTNWIKRAIELGYLDPEWATRFRS